MTAAEITAEVEHARMARAIEIKRLREKLKLEYECITSQMRAQMNRDGVVKHKIPGVGTATLVQPKSVAPCESCSQQFGFIAGTLDPYLKIEADNER